MDAAFTLQLVPVDPFTAKVGIFVLVLLSFVTGNMSYFRVKKAYSQDQEVPRQPIHIFFNILTVLGAAFLIVIPETSDAGWIVLMFAVAAFVSGIFTYRSMEIQMERGDDALDAPSMHATAGLLLLLYTAYIAFWELIGIGGLIFG